MLTHIYILKGSAICINSSCSAMSNPSSLLVRTRLLSYHNFYTPLEIPAIQESSSSFESDQTITMSFIPFSERHSQPDTSDIVQPKAPTFGEPTEIVQCRQHRPIAEPSRLFGFGLPEVAGEGQSFGFASVGREEHIQNPFSAIPRNSETMDQDMIDDGQESTSPAIGTDTNDSADVSGTPIFNPVEDNSSHTYNLRSRMVEVPSMDRAKEVFDESLEDDTDLKKAAEAIDDRFNFNASLDRGARSDMPLLEPPQDAVIQAHELFHWNHNVPKTLAELFSLVEACNVPCTCDACNKKAYKNARWHKQIFIRPNGVPMLTMGLSGTHETLYLARQTIAYFERPVEEFNETQLAAVQRFKELRVLMNEGPSSRSNIFKPALILEFLRVFNDIFFMSAIKFDFDWANARAPAGSAVSVYHPDDGTATFRIVMCSASWQPNCKSSTPDRLGALLHEAIHAFFMLYACKECKTEHFNVGAGHGRAWQMVAFKLEEVLPRLLGVSVNLGRFEALRRDLVIDKSQLPSLHDFAEYGMQADAEVPDKNAIADDDRTCT